MHQDAAPTVFRTEKRTSDYRELEARGFVQRSGARWTYWHWPRSVARSSIWKVDRCGAAVAFLDGLVGDGNAFRGTNGSHDVISGAMECHHQSILIEIRSVILIDFAKHTSGKFYFLNHGKPELPMLLGIFCTWSWEAIGGIFGFSLVQSHFVLMCLQFDW